jgi:hypothetical protein
MHFVYISDFQYIRHERPNWVSELKIVRFSNDFRLCWLYIVNIIFSYHRDRKKYIINQCFKLIYGDAVDRS